VSAAHGRGDNRPPPRADRGSPRVGEQRTRQHGPRGRLWRPARLAFERRHAAAVRRLAAAPAPHAPTAAPCTPGLPPSHGDSAMAVQLEARGARASQVRVGAQRRSSARARNVASFSVATYDSALSGHSTVYVRPWVLVICLKFSLAEQTPRLGHHPGAATALRAGLEGSCMVFLEGPGRVEANCSYASTCLSHAKRLGRVPTAASLVEASGDRSTNVPAASVLSKSAWTARSLRVTCGAALTTTLRCRARSTMLATAAPRAELRSSIGGEVQGRPS